MQDDGHPLAAPASAVTEIFMEVYYSESPLTEERERTVEASLREIEGKR